MSVALEPDGQATACKAVSSGFNSHRRLFWAARSCVGRADGAYCCQNGSDFETISEITDWQFRAIHLASLAKRGLRTGLMRQTMRIVASVVSGITVASLVIVKTP